VAVVEPVILVEQVLCYVTTVTKVVAYQFEHGQLVQDRAALGILQMVVQITGAARAKTELSSFTHINNHGDITYEKSVN
jgi:hypothetical protein